MFPRVNRLSAPYLMMTGDPETITVSSTSAAAAAVAADGVVCAAADADAGTAAYDPLIFLDTEVEDIVVIAVTVTAVFGWSQGLVWTTVRVVAVVCGSKSGNDVRVVRRSGDRQQLLPAAVVR